MARKSRKQRKAKAKRKAYIAKISRDGKINKKEAVKAAKKGISLQTIQNENIRNYRDSVKAYENRDPEVYNPRNPTGQRPTFEPLLIKRLARDTFNAASQPPVVHSTPATPAATETAPVATEPTMQEMFDNYTSSLPDYGAMMEASNASNAQMVQDIMASNQAAAQQRASEYESQLTRMRQEQEAAQAEYQRQAEEQRKQFELAQRTSLGNQARAGQQANYQLGGTPGMKRGGTFGFRRRRRQLMGGIGASGLAQSVAGTIAGTLNV